MAVPTSAADLSTTASSNSPAGTDPIGTSLDDYLRSIQAIIKQENSKGSDIASSTSISVPNAGSYFVVTGTTTITTITDSWVGRQVALKFSGALTLTHGAGLILPGAASITTVAGDCLYMVNESTGVWRVLVYQKANGYLAYDGSGNIDINGGTIDGTVIGGSSAAAITGTTITATTSFSGALNGTVGATTPAAGTFTTLSTTGNVTLGDASTDTVTVNGYMALGTTPQSNTGMAVAYTANSTNSFGVSGQPTFNSGVLTTGTAVDAFASTQATAFTLPNLYLLRARGVTKGSGSTIDNLYGVFVADLTAGGSSAGQGNFGVASTVSSGTNKWNIYASGTADNYFAGDVGIGTTSPNTALTVYKGSAATNSIQIANSTTGSAAGDGFLVGVDASGNAFLSQQEALPIIAYTNGSERLRIDSSGHLATGTDNTQTLGTAAKRWSVVYAGTGTINTSDAREKTTVTSLSADEINAAKQLAREIGTYKFLASVAEKGESARKHVGMTVQRAIEIMQANNLSPFAYGFICYDEWQEQSTTDENGNVTVTQTAGSRYAFRPDELLMFVARGFEARLAALEAA